MTMWLKQSTAATIVLGPFVDETDGKTAETSLTISQADIRLSKNGAAFAQTNNSAGATHMEIGYYSVPLDTTDTNTLGRLKVAVSESGALPVWMDLMILPANVYDSLIAGSDKLDVNAAEYAGQATDSTDVALATAPTNFAALAITGGGAVTAGTVSDKTGYSLADGAITAAVIATGAIDADAIADNAIDAGAIASGTITSAKFAAGAIDAAAIATDAIDADAIAASAVTEIASGITVDCSEIEVTLAQTPAQIANLVDGDHLTFYRDSKFTARLYVTGGISSDRDDFLLTVKTRDNRDSAAADTKSLLQWSEDSGLLYINEATAASAGVASSDGTLTITNSTVGGVTTGIVDLTLTAQAAALLARQSDLVWDGKEIHTNPDNSVLKIEGTAQVKAAATRTID